MPTTIGHSLAGIVASQTKLFLPSRNLWKSLLVSVVLTNLADIDFLPGFFVGNPNRFHHGVTHSLGAAVVVGVLFGLFFQMRQRKFLVPFAFACLLYSSHILLDFLTIDTSPPCGVPVFWPLFSEHYISPVKIFSAVHKDSTSSTFFQSLLVPDNLITVFREIAILAPLMLLVRALSKKTVERNFELSK